MITQGRLKEVLDYNKETGIFTWKLRLSNRGLVGERAGSFIKPHNYREIGIDSISYLEHRLAWLYVYGVFPEGELDHKDNTPYNNSILNIREADRFQQTRNCRVSKNNKCGVKGVSWRNDKKKWRAVIYLNGKQKHLGYFTDKEYARKAYCDAADMYFREFANHG